VLFKKNEGNLGKLIKIYREEIQREVRRTKLGIYAEENSLKAVETATSSMIETPTEIVDEYLDMTTMELVDEEFNREIESKKEQAEKNRLAALAKLAARKKQREEEMRLEEEAKVAAMIAESGHLFFE
jgi:hypothetical protein